MRTLIAGSGLIGRALAGRLTASGGEAILASRNPPAGSHLAWRKLDVADREICRRVIDSTAPDAIVLVHGPSDVTWCDSHPSQALDVHARAAHHFARLSGERRIVLISTDNVFDGVAETSDESAPTGPANAYGRAKLAAEQALCEAANATVLRVSLVYGWEPAGSTKWLNFFAASAHRLRRGQTITAPYDQWTTPVLVDDVAAVTEAVLGASALPLLHLGGPQRTSRAGWARVIAEELGVPPDLVIDQPRRAGRYAGRPENSCLSSTILHRHPATGQVPVHGIREAARMLLASPGRQPVPTT